MTTRDLPGADPRCLSAVCCDVDGVLLRGGVPVPGVGTFLHALHRRRVPLALLTNHAEARPAALAAIVTDLGYPLTESDVITSATLVASRLRSEGVASAFVVGGPVLKATLAQAGIVASTVNDPAEVVVVGFVEAATSIELAAAVRRIAGGARFIATNADVLVPSRDGVGLETGAWLALLQAAGTGVPEVLGKPATAAFRFALTRLGAPAIRTLMVGDSLGTDIVGAKAAGMPTCRVRSGNGPTDTAADAAADLAFDDVAALAASWDVNDPFSLE